MITNAMFSLGNAWQILLMFLAPVVIDLIFAGAAVVARRRAAQEVKHDKQQWKLDLAIGIFALLGPLEILGLVFIRYGATIVGESLAVAAVFLWPVSTLLASRARGFGRKEILFGSSLIGLWVFGFGVVLSIH